MSRWDVQYEMLYRTDHWEMKSQQKRKVKGHKDENVNIILSNSDYSSTVEKRNLNNSILFTLHCLVQVLLNWETVCALFPMWLFHSCSLHTTNDFLEHKVQIFYILCSSVQLVFAEVHELLKALPHQVTNIQIPAWPYI